MTNKDEIINAINTRIINSNNDEVINELNLLLQDIICIYNNKNHSWLKDKDNYYICSNCMCAYKSPHQFCPTCSVQINSIIEV